MLSFWYRTFLLISRVLSCDLLQQLCIKNYFFDFIDFKFNNLNKSKWTFFRAIRLSTFVFSSEGGVRVRIKVLFLRFYYTHSITRYCMLQQPEECLLHHVSFLTNFFLRGDLNTLLLFMKASMGKVEKKNSRLITILVIPAPHVEASHVRLPKHLMIPARHVEASHVRLPKHLVIPARHV